MPTYPNTGSCIIMALPLLTSTVSCGALRTDIRNLGYLFFFNLVIIWLFVFFNLVIFFQFGYYLVIWFFLFGCLFFFFNLVIWLFGFFNLVICFFNVVFRFGFAKSQEVGGQAVEPQTWISNVLLAHGLVAAAPQPGDASGFHILPLCLWHHSSCKRNSSQGQSQCWQGAGFKTITQ